MRLLAIRLIRKRSILGTWILPNTRMYISFPEIEHSASYLLQVQKRLDSASWTTLLYNYRLVKQCVVNVNNFCTFKGVWQVFHLPCIIWPETVPIVYISNEVLVLCRMK